MKQKAFQLPAEVLYLNVQGSKTKFSSFYYGSSVLLVTPSLNSRVIFYSFPHHVTRMCSIYSVFLPSIPRQCMFGSLWLQTWASNCLPLLPTQNFTCTFHQNYHQNHGFSTSVFNQETFFPPKNVILIFSYSWAVQVDLSRKTWVKNCLKFLLGYGVICYSRYWSRPVYLNASYSYFHSFSPSVFSTTLPPFRPNFLCTWCFLFQSLSIVL